MFVEKRIIGKNIKYYLVYSFRDCGEVVKIRKYLGQNLSVEELKNNKEKAEKFLNEQLKYYKEIRNPFDTVLSEQELSQLKKLEKKNKFKISHLSEGQWLKFSEFFSYNTNAIEGSTLTQTEVVDIGSGKNISKKSKFDIEEAKSVIEAINYIRKNKIGISLNLLKKIHYIVFRKTKSFAGKFRSKGIEVVIGDKFGNIVHRGSPSNKIIDLLKDLIKWYDENKNKYSPILLAVVVHNQFENIHPFQDGNGRVGRILLNNILLKHNMPPVDIEFENRQEYYQALQIYEKKGNVRPMIELIIKEYSKLKKKLRLITI